MKRNNIGYARQLVKFGDTPNDIKEGHNALCTSVGVLSGASDEKVLREAGAKHIIDSVMDITIDDTGHPRQGFFKRLPQARWMSSTIPSPCFRNVLSTTTPPNASSITISNLKG